MMTPTEKYNQELYHYGVKGMKWGVRRYTNADGSLNARGRARYAELKTDLDSFEAHAQLAYANARGAASKYRSATTRSDKNKWKQSGERSMDYATRNDKAAARTVKKIEKMGQKVDRWETTAQMKAKAGQDYIKRSMAVKVGTVALTTAVSAGAFYAQTQLMGLPIGAVYVTSGGSHKMRKE